MQKADISAAVNHINELMGVRLCCLSSCRCSSVLTPCDAAAGVGHGRGDSSHSAGMTRETLSRLRTAHSCLLCVQVKDLTGKTKGWRHLMDQLNSAGPGDYHRHYLRLAQNPEKLTAARPPRCDAFSRFLRLSSLLLSGC